MEFWKKQRKILIAFGVFLIFMLFCTLISRAVYASRLPQVTVDTPRRMALNHTVRADGIVHQGREYAVTALSGLRVRTVYTNVGDKVTPETLLFDLDMEDLNEKIREKELEIKKCELQIAALAQNRGLDAQKQQTENARAQEDYQRAQEKAGKDLERAREDLADAEDAYDSHEDHPVKTTSKADREARQAAYEEWVKKEAELRQALDAAQKEAEEASAKVKELEEAAKTAEPAPKEPEGGTAGGSETSPGTPEDGGEGGGAQDGTGTSPGTPQESAKGTDAGQAEAPEKREDPELSAAKEQEKAAMERLEAAKSAYEAHTRDPVEKPDFSGEDAEKSAWEEKKDSLEDGVDAARRAVEDAERSEADSLLDAGRKVEDARQADSADSSLEVSQLELAALQEELASYQKVRDASGQVYPEAEGVITRIQVSPGERVGDGAAVVYADLSSPMQFQVSLTKDQKKYVNQGDAVELTLGGSSKKELRVDYVAENELNPELYDARVFLPEGEGTIGESGNFQVEAQSETFGCCIPLNALHIDANQRTFVYIVSERSGILGTELAAEQVYVKVLDQNDSYAAVEEGVIDRETELIISSTEELEDRMVIRYKE